MLQLENLYMYLQALVDDSFGFFGQPLQFNSIQGQLLALQCTEYKKMKRIGEHSWSRITLKARPNNGVARLTLNIKVRSV